MVFAQELRILKSEGFFVCVTHLYLSRYRLSPQLILAGLKTAKKGDHMNDDKPKPMPDEPMSEEK